MGNSTVALQAFREAISLDDEYSIKWAEKDQEEFIGYGAAIDEMLEKLTASINVICKNFRIKAVGFLKWALATIDRVSIHEISKGIGGSTIGASKGKLIEEISLLLNEISACAVSKKGYLDALRVKAYTLAASNQLCEIARNFASWIEGAERSLNTLPDQAKHNALADGRRFERKHLSDDDFWGLNLLVAALSFVALVVWAFYMLSDMPASLDTFWWIIKAIILVPIGAILASVIFNLIRIGLITVYNAKLTSDKQRFYSVQHQRATEAFDRACTAIAPFRLELAEAKEAMALQLKVINSLEVAPRRSEDRRSTNR